MSTSTKYRPLTFSDYLEQTGASNYLKSVIKTNKHPSGIIIAGASGSGKTTLAQLYVKSTLCETREKGDYQPCNTCNSCTSLIHKNQHPNITYYSITEASTFKEAVGDLITLTKATPVCTHDNIRDDNLRRFILIDEVQSASRQSISPFLDSLEFALDNITIILISMDLDKMDYIVREAIESRCIELSLSPVSSSSISAKLQTVYNQLHPSSADLIAYLSKGNVRKAWQTLEYFEVNFPDISLLTPEHISKDKLGGLNKEICKTLFSSIQSKSWDITYPIIKNIFNNEEVAISYFLSFLVEQDLNIEGVNFISSLSFWLQSNYKIPISSVFKLYQGKNLMNITNNNKITSVFPVKEIHSPTTTTLDLIKVSSSITSQLEKLSGKSLTSYYVKVSSFSFTKWTQYLTHYVSN